MKLAEKLIRTRRLDREEYQALLRAADVPEVRKRLTDEAVRLRRQYYGNAIYIRGLIEFTNYCKNNCYYCGIRRSNSHAARYRMTPEEILSCCRNGYEMGFRTFVLQGGEDPYFTEERVAQLVRAVKTQFPDCAVTLSIGEKPRESYRRFREAGADRYLLRHETASARHYAALHPPDMRLSERKQCLYDLKSLGYQTGAGFMIGSPEQTLAELAEDLVFLGELSPQMVGIGPFIPHHDTRYAKEPAGSVELTLFLLSVLRIMLPQALIPATTALGTLDKEGREKGILAGANVVMFNLSPVEHRKQYALYDHKICALEDTAKQKESFARRMQAWGYELAEDKGDAVR